MKSFNTLTPELFLFIFNPGLDIFCMNDDVNSHPT